MTNNVYNWVQTSGTSKKNRGYNLIYGISGHYRSYVSQGTGMAITGYNIAFNFGGKGSVCIQWYQQQCTAYGAVYSLSSVIWDNFVQHETSHNFWVSDTDSGSHIMNSGVTGFMFHDTWINWLDDDEETISSNESKFDTSAS